MLELACYTYICVRLQSKQTFIHEGAITELTDVTAAYTLIFQIKLQIQFHRTHWGNLTAHPSLTYRTPSLLCLKLLQHNTNNDWIIFWCWIDHEQKVRWLKSRKIAIMKTIIQIAENQTSFSCICHIHRFLRSKQQYNCVWTPGEQPGTQTASPPTRNTEDRHLLILQWYRFKTKYVWKC